VRKSDTRSESGISRVTTTNRIIHATLRTPPAVLVGLRSRDARAIDGFTAISGERRAEKGNALTVITSAEASARGSRAVGVLHRRRAGKAPECGSGVHGVPQVTSLAIVLQ
jgi:hypothetical protein